MSSRWRRLGVAAGLGALGGLGASWWLGGRLTAPQNAPVGPKPDDFDLEDVEFDCASGHPVCGWWRPGERGQGAVVLLHALRDNRRHMLERQRLLAEQGIGSLALDLRAHGESRGQRITFGLRESEDAHAAVEFARERSGGERVGAVGFSLGGASTLLGPKPVEVDALVLEAVYPSLVEAIEARLATRFGDVLAKLLAPLFVAQVRPRLGAPISALRPIEGIRRVKSPVLVAGGAHDPKTPFAHTERLFAAAPEPKELWRVEGAGHEDFLARDPRGYRERVLGFLRRHLAPAVVLIASSLLGAEAARASAGRGTFRCDGTTLQCRDAIAGADWVEEYRGFLVYGGAPPGRSARSRPTRRLPDTLHLGTFAFDPREDPAEAPGDDPSGGAHAEGDDYAVQFVAPIRQRWLDALAAAGLELVQFLPHRAYLVHGTPAAIERARRLERVRAVVRIRPAHRLPAALLWAVGAARAEVAPFGRDGRAPYDIALAKRADRAAAESAVQALGGRILARLELPSNYFDLLRAELPPPAVGALAARPGVVRIDPYIPPEPEDERAAQIVAGNYTDATTIAAPGYDPAAQFGVDGTGVTVAIVDDGVGIPGDGGRYVTSSNAVNGPLRGAAAGANGHGHLNATIVAGAAPFGALDPDGYNYGLGVAPGAHVVNIPSLRSGYAGTDAEAVNDTVATAGPNGAAATISNNSWGNGTNANAYDSLAAAYDGFARDASSAGSIDPLLLVFSAGNAGGSGLTRPKMAKNVIAVAATENLRSTLSTSVGSTGAADNLEEVPDFSSRGLAADGRIKPDLAAPGAAVAGGRSGADTLFGNIDAEHRHSTGTSHAAPQVAGAAALFTEQWRAAHGGADPSPAMVKAALVNGTVEVTGAGAAAARPNGAEGWGRIHLGNSLDPAIARTAWDEPLRLDGPGDRFDATLAVDSGALPLRVTLVWSDPPAAVDPALVNDLDLELTAGGALYRGNRFAGGVSIAGGDPNTLDNVETILVPAGVLGAGTPVAVRVVASELNGDGALGEGDATDQRFALVISNAAETDSPVLRAELLPLESESCAPANGRPDPGEYVTTSLCLRNDGNATTGDLSAALDPGAGVDPVTGPRGYGTLPPDASACRTFGFAVSDAHPCGEPLALAFSIDDGGGLGDHAARLETGELVAGAPQTFASTVALAIPARGAASVYPSSLTVAATGDVLVEVELGLDDLSHTYPSDLDLRLVSPAGTAATLFSDVGGGADVTDRDFVLDDDASASLGTGTLASGTYRPTNLGGSDTLPAPAPDANAATAMSVFAGADPDGAWQLFVADDEASDAGSLAGWSLRLTMASPVCATTCPLLFADGFELGSDDRWSP